MVSIHDTKPQSMIENAADDLKKIDDLKMPEWANFVKTGAGRERPPMQSNWWHMRAASMLRRIALTGPIGVSKLRTKYSNKKNRGHKPEKVYQASGKIIRTLLQQLEKAGLIRYTEKGVHKGRVLTPAGQSFLAKAAKDGATKPVAAEKPAKVEKPVAEEKPAEAKKPVAEEKPAKEE